MPRISGKKTSFQENLGDWNRNKSDKMKRLLFGQEDTTENENLLSNKKIPFYYET